MDIKITCILLALAATCSCLGGGFGGSGGPSGTDPGFRLRQTSSSRGEPVPKIQPLALTRPGFNPGLRRIDTRPGPGNMPKGRFGIRVTVRPGGNNPRIQPPPFPRRDRYHLPDVRRPPIDLRPRGQLPSYLPPGGIHCPGPVHVPVNLPHLRNPFIPGGHGPFGIPSGGMNNGPFNNVPGVNDPFYRNPPMLPGQGGNFGPGGPPPRQPNQRRSNFNEVNQRSRDDNDKEKDLPQGTVVVTVAAANKTDAGTVHANVTIFVVPKEGENKETFELDSKQHLNAAQGILDAIFNKNKSDDQKSKKTSKNLDDVLNKLAVPKL